MLKERKGHKGPDGVKGRRDTSVSLVRNRSAWSRWSVVADFLHILLSATAIIFWLMYKIK